MQEVINMTVNTIIQVVEGLIIIFMIAKVFDTYNYVKKIIENQDYENQRIYEIENQLDEIMMKLNEKNQNDEITNKTQNE